MVRRLVLAALALGACDASGSGKTDAAPTASTTAAAMISAAPAAKAAPAIANQWKKAIGLKAPESVVHDEKSDVYLVSNIEGKPLDMDGHGFISKLAPVGQGVELKWIEGGKNKVVLNAPKGMGLTADTLWVADIDTVRTFDRTTGNPTGDVKIPGATFLNDIAVAPDGRVLVTDSGFRTARDGGLEASGSDAVYAIATGKGNDKERKVTTIAKSKALSGPNGIVPFGDHQAYVVTTGSGEMYSLDLRTGERDTRVHLPKGTLDGLVLALGEYFVSSWDANAIYRGKPGETFAVAIENVKSAADIGFDRKRSWILVPLMNDDEVRAYELK